MNLADLGRREGKPLQVEPLYREAIAIFEQTAPDHPRHADTLTYLAALFVSGRRENRGRVEASADGNESAITLIRRAQPEDMETQRSVARLLRLRNRHTEADRLESFIPELRSLR